MKILSLRALSRDAPSITEAVLVLHDRRVIGQYTPITDAMKELAPTIKIGETKPRPTLDLTGYKEAPVDDVKKAIEPDKVKESRGRLTKGLGDVPGQTEERRDPQDTFGHSKPAPKPGKSK